MRKTMTALIAAILILTTAVLVHNAVSQETSTATRGATPVTQAPPTTEERLATLEKKIDYLIDVMGKRPSKRDGLFEYLRKEFDEVDEQLEDNRRDLRGLQNDVGRIPTR
jgi:hypothetical protein